MLATYLDGLDLPDRAAVVEIGCGTGAISRVLAARPGVGEVTGVDPSPVFLDRARELSASVANLSFRQGDGRDLPLPDGSFDLAVLHTVLSHVPGPEVVLAQAFRVLRPGGALAVFDGDYNTVSVATGPADPLQACVDAFVQGSCHDPWVIRRLPGLAAAAGFTGIGLRSHGYAQITEPAYLLSLIDRGTDALAAAGGAGPSWPRPSSPRAAAGPRRTPSTGTSLLRVHRLRQPHRAKAQLARPARGGPRRCFPDERRRREEGAPKERGGKAAPPSGPGASQPAQYSGAVRLTAFWERMNAQFGEAYAASVAKDQVLARLAGRTVQQALADGIDPKIVWAAVCDTFELPESRR